MSEGARQEPRPSGARLLPPSLPPAPPGTGESGRSSGGDRPGPRTFSVAFEPLQNAIAVIGVAYETLGCYPDDADLKADLLPVAHAAQQQVNDGLAGLAVRVVAADSDFTAERLEAFKRCLLELVGKITDQVNAAGLLQDASAIASVDARELPPRAFFLTILKALRQSIAKPVLVGPREEFEAEVYSRVMALLMAAYLADG